MSGRRRWTGLALLAWLAAAPATVSCSPAWAVQPDEVLADPVLEGRARALSMQLRCLVCQNQSIDDSAAPLARDLRLLVRERLQAGDSDEQVKQYLVSRYGDFVLLKPPFNRETLLLWLTPVLVLTAGGTALLLRRRGRPDPVPALRPDEEARLAALAREPRAG